MKPVTSSNAIIISPLILIFIRHKGMAYKNVNIWAPNYWYEFLCHAFFSLFSAQYAMNWLFFVMLLFCALIQNFIDSLCRQSVDIGYYYYFSFVLRMTCCELISIGYFFFCVCVFAHLFLIHAHFIRIGMYFLFVRLPFVGCWESSRKICQTLFLLQITPASWNMFHLWNGF